MLIDFLETADSILAIEYAFNAEKPDGLLYSQYRVLRCLSKNETLKTVSRRRKITQQATGKAVSRLVEKGFAVRIKHPLGKKNTDRRERSISVTAEGKEALKFADKAIRALIRGANSD